MTRFFCRVATVLALLFLIAAPARATNTTYLPGNAAVATYETVTGTTFVITCPALAAAGADTNIVILNVTKAMVPFVAPGVGNVPSVKASYMVVAGAGAVVDSIRCEQSFGLSPTNAAGKIWFFPALIGLDANCKLTGKTPLEVQYKHWALPYMRLKIVNKHGTLARTPVLYVTFIRPVWTGVARSGF